MPEGHSVHRIALQFERDFVGFPVAASSPQGRFAAGAAQLDGRTMQESIAVGKQMFLRFDGERWLRIHLGIYGAWDFFGRISPITPDSDVRGSMGAPRLRRAIRLAETEHVKDIELDEWPPVPIGAVRVRLATAESVADLRGPTACEVLDPEQVQVVLDRLGPDPATDSGDDARDVFVERLRKSGKPVGLQLMDQSIVSGIGNVYRAEMLFRARLNPHLPAKLVSVETARSLWGDWSYLLEIGIRTGLMLTMETTDPEERARAVSSRDDRHWVYKREGLPCRVCGTAILIEMMAGRKLYWCPSCQA
ncbi:Fpg/Nei family DNA glycosylase [Microbacteriaceae bacterium VKM Ac-2855]|nr:Fpg/Nei family DNA glycosylase [Microbacteriaceae bacterium VKM Ac-2855]